MAHGGCAGYVKAAPAHVPIPKCKRASFVRRGQMVPDDVMIL